LKLYVDMLSQAER